MRKTELFLSQHCFYLLLFFWAKFSAIFKGEFYSVPFGREKKKMVILILRQAIYFCQFSCLSFLSAHCKQSSLFLFPIRISLEGMPEVMRTEIIDDLKLLLLSSCAEISVEPKIILVSLQRPRELWWRDWLQDGRHFERLCRGPCSASMHVYTRSIWRLSLRVEW